MGENGGYPNTPRKVEKSASRIRETAFISATSKTLPGQEVVIKGGGDGIMYGKPKQLFPKEWEGRKSISAAEYNAWQAGKLKTKEKKLPKLRINAKQDFAIYHPGVLTIVIHEIPPSQNVWRTWHYRVRNQESQRWNDLIIILVRNVFKGQINKPIVKFRFFFPDNRPRDIENYESWKPLLDGLTMAGTITDDNYKVMSKDKSEAGIDRQNPRVEIVVREG